LRRQLALEGLAGQALMNAAPAVWHQRLATADLSWMYDATNDGLAP
jgi:hypothetical protein